MLLTEELTKIALVLNSKGFLRRRHCDKNSENFFRYRYYYNYHYSTLISTIFFVHLETQDLFSFLMNVFLVFWVSIVFLRDISLHFCIISIIVIRTVKISLVIIIIII